MSDSVNRNNQFHNDLTWEFGRGFNSQSASVVERREPEWAVDHVTKQWTNNEDEKDMQQRHAMQCTVDQPLGHTSKQQPFVVVDSPGKQAGDMASARSFVPQWVTVRTNATDPEPEAERWIDAVPLKRQPATVRLSSTRSETYTRKVAVLNPSSMGAYMGFSDIHTAAYHTRKRRGATSSTSVASTVRTDRSGAPVYRFVDNAGTVVKVTKLSQVPQSVGTMSNSQRQSRSYSARNITPRRLFAKMTTVNKLSSTTPAFIHSDHKPHRKRSPAPSEKATVTSNVNLLSKEPPKPKLRQNSCGITDKPSKLSDDLVNRLEKSKNEIAIRKAELEKLLNDNNKNTLDLGKNIKEISTDSNGAEKNNNPNEVSNVDKSQPVDNVENPQQTSDSLKFSDKQTKSNISDVPSGVVAGSNKTLISSVRKRKPNIAVTNSPKAEESPKKVRHYDPKEAREYIKKKNQIRRSKIQAEINSKKQLIEEKKRKLKELDEQRKLLRTKKSKPRTQLHTIQENSNANALKVDRNNLSDKENNEIDNNKMIAQCLELNHRIDCDVVDNLELSNDIKNINSSHQVVDKNLENSVSKKNSHSLNVPSCSLFDKKRIFTLDEKDKAAQKIQCIYRGYRQRRIYKNMLLSKKTRENVALRKSEIAREVPVVQKSMIPTNEKIPSWLMPATALPYPYNFISVVKKKLNLAIQGHHNDVTIFSPSQHNITSITNTSYSSPRSSLESVGAVSADKNPITDYKFSSGDLISVPTTRIDSHTTAPEIKTDTPSHPRIDDYDNKKSTNEDRSSRSQINSLKTNIVISDNSKNNSTIKNSFSSLESSPIDLIGSKVEKLKLEINGLVNKIDKTPKRQASKSNITLTDEEIRSVILSYSQRALNSSKALQKSNSPKNGHYEDNSNITKDDTEVEKTPRSNSTGNDIESAILSFSENKLTESGLKTDSKLSTKQTSSNVEGDVVYDENTFQSDSNGKLHNGSISKSSTSSSTKHLTAAELLTRPSDKLDWSSILKKSSASRHSINNDFKSDVKHTENNRVMTLTAEREKFNVHNTNADVKYNSNEICLKFQAELHLLNTYKDSVREMMQKDKPVSKAHPGVSQVTQTSPVSESQTQESSKKSSYPSSRKSEMSTSLRSSETKINEQIAQNPNSNKLKCNEAQMSSFNTVAVFNSKDTKFPEPNTSSSTIATLQDDSSNRKFKNINFSRGTSDTIDSPNNTIASSNLDISKLVESYRSSTDSAQALTTVKMNRKNMPEFDNSLITMSLEMIEEQIYNEDFQLEQFKTVMRLREKALIDRTRGELANLELKKKLLRQDGKISEASVLKKKQRGLLLKLQQEKHEMRRLKQMQKATCEERKVMYKAQQNMFKKQLTTKNMLMKLKRTPSIELKRTGPLKVYDVRSKSNSHTSAESTTEHESHYSYAVSEELSIHTQSVMSNIPTEVPSEKESVDFRQSIIVRSQKHFIQPEKLKDSLKKHEEELKKRRETVEELLKWHQRLLEEEKDIIALENEANQLVTQKSVPMYTFTGTQLNKIWRNISLRKEKRFTDNKIYKLTKQNLDKFYEEAKIEMLKNIPRSANSDMISTPASDVKYDSSFESLNLTSISNKSGVSEKKGSKWNGLPKDASTHSEIRNIGNSIINKSLRSDESVSTQYSENIHESTSVDESNEKDSVKNIKEHSSAIGINLSINGVEKSETNPEEISKNNSGTESITLISEIIEGNEFSVTDKTLAESNLEVNTSKNQSEENEILSKNVLNGSKSPNSSENIKEAEASPQISVQQSIGIEEKSVENTESVITETQNSNKNETLFTEENSNKTITDSSSSLKDAASLPTSEVVPSSISVKSSAALPAEIQSEKNSEVKSNKTSDNSSEEILITSANIEKASPVIHDEIQDSPIFSASESSKSVFQFDENIENNIKDSAISKLDDSISYSNDLQDLSSGKLSIDVHDNIYVKNDSPSTGQSGIKSELEKSNENTESKLVTDADVLSENKHDANISNNKIEDHQTPTVLDTVESNNADGKYSSDEKSAVSDIKLNDSVNEDSNSSGAIKASSINFESPANSLENDKPVDDRNNEQMSEKSNVLSDSSHEEPKSSEDNIEEELKIDDSSHEKSLLNNEDKSINSSISEESLSHSSTDMASKITVDVRKRVCEILADALPASRHNSPRIQDLWTTTSDIISPETSPESGSPIKDTLSSKSLPKESIVSEAEELLRKQLEIELEIKELEKQQQQESLTFYLREIPNKPPPPYTPPATQTVAAIKPEVISILTQPDKVSEIVSKITETLHDSYLKGELNKAELPVEIIEDVDNESVTKCNSFLFDLCKEITKEIYKPSESENAPSWMKCNNKITVALKPKCVDELKDVLDNKVKQMLGLTLVECKENLIICWSRKKRDHVDELLVRESQVEETEWTNFENDEATVKNELTNDLFNMLLEDTVQAVSTAFTNKQLKLL